MREKKVTSSSKKPTVVSQCLNCQVRGSVTSSESTFCWARSETELGLRCFLPLVSPFS